MAGGNDTAAVRNCTLEDIDAVCLDFQRYELKANDTAKIFRYAKTSLGLKHEEGISEDGQNWFNCTRCQSEEKLCSQAVDYVLGRLKLC